MLFVCLWHDFDNCPLLPAPSPGALSRPTHPRALDTHPHLPNCLPRSPLSISEARQGPWDQLSTTPSSWVLLSGVPPFFAYLNWGGGAAGWFELHPHPPSNHNSSFWGLGRRAALQAASSGTRLPVQGRCAAASVTAGNRSVHWGCCCCCCRPLVSAGVLDPAQSTHPLPRLGVGCVGAEAQPS